MAIPYRRYCHWVDGVETYNTQNECYYLLVLQEQNIRPTCTLLEKGQVIWHGLLLTNQKPLSNVGRQL